MTRFENKLCPVCRTRFIKGAEVVVCPTCGTPHHRSCYSMIERCAFESLHAEGWTWKGLLPDEEKHRDEMLKAAGLPTIEPNKTWDELPREEFPSASSTSSSGSPPPYDEEQRMFEELGDDNPYSELFRKFEDKEIGEDGVSMHELVAFSATSVYHYGRVFDTFRRKSESSGKKRVVSFNLSSGLFAPMFQGYRKMNIFGIIALLLMLVPSIIAVLIPDEIAGEVGNELLLLLQLLNVMIRILLCAFGDYVYYRHCISRIKKFRKSYDGDTRSDDYYLALYELGKPTYAGAAIGCLAMMLGYASVIYLVG